MILSMNSTTQGNTMTNRQALKMIKKGIKVQGLNCTAHGSRNKNFTIQLIGQDAEGIAAVMIEAHGFIRTAMSGNGMNPRLPLCITCHPEGHPAP